MTIWHKIQVSFRS